MNPFNYICMWTLDFQIDSVSKYARYLPIFQLKSSPPPKHQIWHPTKTKDPIYLGQCISIISERDATRRCVCEEVWAIKTSITQAFQWRLLYSVATPHGAAVHRISDAGYTPHDYFDGISKRPLYIYIYVDIVLVGKIHNCSHIQNSAMRPARSGYLRKSFSRAPNSNAYMGLLIITRPNGGI